MRVARAAAKTAVLAALALASLVASSSTELRAQPPNQRGGRPGEPGQVGRDRLERQFRERLADVVRRRLNLDDAQMVRLGQVNDRFERERMELLRQERQARMALRDEVLAGESANQTKVAELLDQTLRVQRRRLDLLETEQRELATFMTPVQRAMYFGIQDEMRRRMEDFRQQRRQGAPGAAGRRPPGGPRP
jgi:Spy/CpxP family protein refolding chaperone